MVAQTWHPDAKHYGYGFHYNPELDKIDLITDAPADVMAPLRQRFPDTLTYRTGRVGRATRQNDPPPHWGGAVIVNSAHTEWCTSGFAVLATNGRRYMTTAGHCYPFINQVFGWNHDYWGSIRYRAQYPLWDVEAIGKDESGNGGEYGSAIYVGNVYGVGKFVSGAGSVTVGSQYCISGTVGNETCSQQVVSTSGTLCTPECTGGLIKTYKLPDGDADTFGGDSGAPVYNYTGSNPTKVVIRGMFIGYGSENNNNYNYSEHWQGIANLLQVTIVT